MKIIAYVLLVVAAIGTANIAYEMHQERLFPWQWPTQSEVKP